MARILAISSQVARGHVGLSAIVPALQALGHEVTPLPTILLSNHPGHAEVAGERIAPELLRRMLATLEKNGWLGEVDAVLTGYLPSVEHVAFAVEAVDRVRTANARAVYFCDPVLGDDPKGLYIERTAAEAIRDRLLLKADIAKMNLFELGWLAAGKCDGEAGVIAAALGLGVDVVLVSSVPGKPGMLSNVLLNSTFDAGTGRRQLRTATACRVRVMPATPKGTGDLLSGLMLGHCLRHSDSETARLGAAIAGLQRVVTASQRRDELQLVDHLGSLADCPPHETTDIG